MIIGSSCILELNRSINSKWRALHCATTACSDRLGAWGGGERKKESIACDAKFCVSYILVLSLLRVFDVMFHCHCFRVVLLWSYALNFLFFPP